jgi:methionyl aminopeptidase
MIKIKSGAELEKIHAASVIAATALHLAGRAIKPGLTTYDLGKIIHDYIVKRGAKPSFLGYEGFKGSACISVNNVVIHGLPSPKVKLREGDIVSIDVGAFYQGFHGDTAHTFPVGRVSDEAARLLKTAEESLHHAITKCVAGNRVGDIGYAIESYCERFGFDVVREYIGHGVGRELHEDPEIPNFGKPGRGPRLMNGMTLAIEPMVNQKGSDVITSEKDKWTVVTKSGCLSAHFEHTVVVSPGGPVILTKPAL